MPTPREELSCGVVRDASGVPVEVVTMGGIGFGSGFDVEIFDLGTETWRTAGQYHFLTQEIPAISQECRVF